MLRQLIAVGQVDILVGLPTLNNAATVVDVVRAIHVCFTRDFPRLRTVMINSDGGSTDGTPELIRAASFTEADMVQTSHSLRTLHRVVAPYHGLPGKHTALRTVFAAAELTQAKVLVVIDPGGPATTAERVTELIAPDRRAPRSSSWRRAIAGIRATASLITQLVRPLVRALYGVALDEPLGAEFACSGRFASHCLEQDIWNHEVGEVRDRSVAAHRGGGRAVHRRSDLAAGDDGRRRADHAARGGAAGRPVADREPSRARVVLAERPTASRSCAPGAPTRRSCPTPPTWDYQALAEQARHDIVEIKPLLEERARAGRARATSWTTVGRRASRLDDELWVRIVYAFAAATHRGRTSIEHLADMFVPLYMWRAVGVHVAHRARDRRRRVQARLDSLCETFQRLKPALVASWSDEV